MQVLCQSLPNDRRGATRAISFVLEFLFASEYLSDDLHGDPGYYYKNSELREFFSVE